MITVPSFIRLVVLSLMAVLFVVPLEPLYGAWADVDKLHDGRGGWAANYFNDLNQNGKHDPGEPFADSPDTAWKYAKSASDNSCWLASGCNMLQQAGLVKNAADLYNYYALNGVRVGSSLYTWDEGGLQEYVIQAWMQANSTLAKSIKMEIHMASSTVGFDNGVYAWRDWNPRSGIAEYLARGWQVAIGMWPLASDLVHYGGHALTIESINAGNTFTCTDSDRDFDWKNRKDLNTYSDNLIGAVAYNNHNYYGWYNDFYNGDITSYTVGDFGYVIAIVPEPASLLLAALGSLFLSGMRRKHS